MKDRSKILPISNLGKKSLSLLFFLPLAAILADAAIGSSSYNFLLVVAAIIFLTVIARFEGALILIGISSYFLSYAIWKMNLPGPLINLGYVLIIMVLIREYFFTANLLPVRTPINRILLVIVAFGFLSIAGGNSGVYASFKGLLRHIGFPLLFLLILVAEPNEKLMKKLVIGIIIVAFIQVLASAIQFFWYTAINAKPSGMRADYSGGILGFSCGGYNSVFMAMTFCLMLGIIIVRGFRWYWGIAAAVLALPIFLASARAGIVMFALAAVFMLLVAPLPRHGPFFKRLMIATSLFAVTIVAAFGLGGEGFRAIFNPTYVYDYSIKQADSGMGRLQAFDIVSQSLRNPQEMLIGRGPGMLTPTSISKNPDSLIAENPTLFREITGFAYTTLELGYAGLVLFLLLYVQVYRFTRRFLREIDDPFWESIALGFCGSIFIYVISTVYVDSWIFYPLPFTFWAIAAAIYRVGVIRDILSV
jgi:hypothetical protein